jgi:hypothetical protein
MIPGWTSIVLFIIFFSGLILLSLGIIAQYIWLIYEEVKNRPGYIIKKMHKVNFLIIGAQKAGTTALYQILRQHPDIGMPLKKELHFFDNEETFSKETINYDIYESEFPNKGYKVIGEATPIYCYWLPCASRIHQYNKDFKLIWILRNPVDRAFSHWNMEASRGNEFDDFYKSLFKELEWKKENKEQNRILSYIDRGFYHSQIQEYLKYFNINQIKFIKYENFLKHPDVVIKDLLNFLKVDTSYYYENKIYFQIPYLKKINKKERRYLVKIFKNEIEKIEELLGWNCSDWKKI